MDELVGLREEFDFANAPAAQLEMVARTRFGRPALLLADPVGQPAHFVDRAEIQVRRHTNGRI